MKILINRFGFRYYEEKDIIKWQMFFQKKAHFRTICFDCMNEIWDEKNRLMETLQKKEAERKKTFLFEIEKTKEFVAFDK